MTSQNHHHALEQYRLAGEDAPAWLVAAFALIGIGLCLATAGLLLDQAPWAQQASTTGEARPAMPTDSAPRVMQQEAQQPPEQSTPETSVNQRQESMASPANAAPSPAIPEPATQQEQPSVTQEKLVLPTDCPPDITLTFKSGNARIMEVEKEKLKPIKQWLIDNPKGRLLIEGYADTVGEEQSNFILSYRRAKAVASLLKDLGIPQEQLAVRAAGEHQPIPGLPVNAADYRRTYLQIEPGEICTKPSKTNGQ